MSYANILSELKISIEAVTSIGIVHDRLRLANHEKVVRTLFKKAGVDGDPGRLNAWSITREREEKEYLSQNLNYWLTHFMEVWGWYAVKDVRQDDDDEGSENNFQDLIDGVSDALTTSSRQPQPLNNAAKIMDLPRVDKIDHVMFGRVFCHRVRILFTVREYIPPS